MKSEVLADRYFLAQRQKGRPGIFSAKRSRSRKLAAHDEQGQGATCQAIKSPGKYLSFHYMVCESSPHLVRNICVAGQLFARVFRLFDSAALSVNGFGGILDVFSLLDYSLGDIPVCWSVLFREV